MPCSISTRDVVPVTPVGCHCRENATVLRLVACPPVHKHGADATAQCHSKVRDIYAVWSIQIPQQATTLTVSDMPGQVQKPRYAPLSQWYVAIPVPK